MRGRHSPLIVALCLVLISCAGLVVESDYDPAFDFSRLKTYDWAPPPADRSIDDLTEKRLRSAVNSELQAKGYALSQDAPDFVIAMLVTTETTTAGSVGVGASVGIPVGRGTISVGGGKSEPRIKEEGTLVLDFRDAQSQSVIWKGSASAALHPSSSPEAQQDRIKRAVAELLAKFPPKK
ncbi:MAG: DUF4136 domain-containing protein [Nitrospirota bacterium]